MPASAAISAAEPDWPDWRDKFEGKVERGCKLSCCHPSGGWPFPAFTSPAGWPSAFREGHCLPSMLAPPRPATAPTDLPAPPGVIEGSPGCLDLPFFATLPRWRWKWGRTLGIGNDVRCSRMGIGAGVTPNRTAMAGEGLKLFPWVPGRQQKQQQGACRQMAGRPAGIGTQSAAEELA